MTIADRLIQQLETYLGPHTAKTAVKTFAKRSLSLSPDELHAEHVSVLLDAMQPMLRTLLGEKVAASLSDHIKGALS